MADPILTVTALRKTYGGVTAVADVSLDVLPGEIHAVIGPNGAGKTPRVSLLGGAIPAVAGSIRFQDRPITNLPSYKRARLGIVRSFQITSIFHELSVLDNVALATQAGQGRAYFKMWRPARGDDRLSGPAMAALEPVGLAAAALPRAGAMSHGEHRQLEIAMALATSPELLLLDEPMAGMGVEESARMVTLIGQLKARHAILLVEHDMDAVFALADRITVMVYGQAIRTGTPDEIRADAAVQQAYLGEEGVGDA